MMSCFLQDHAGKFPIISQMARDFLAIPGSSVSVERLFSKSWHLCTDLRCLLKAATITEAMCACQWLKYYDVLKLKNVK